MSLPSPTQAIDWFVLDDRFEVVVVFDEFQDFIQIVWRIGWVDSGGFLFFALCRVEGGDGEASHVDDEDGAVALDVFEKVGVEAVGDLRVDEVGIEQGGVGRVAVRHEILAGMRRPKENVFAGVGMVLDINGNG